MAIDWLLKLKKEKTGWESIEHLIIFPMYKEPYEVVKESFESLTHANYPKEKMMVVLATEESAGDFAKDVAEKTQKDFGNKFGAFLVTVHPKDLPGEIPGKGGNETWAAKEAKKLLIDGKFDPKNVLVSSFDVDTQIFPEYFGKLAHTFLSEENRLRAIYQPIPFFTNNVYDSPAIARVISFSSTFWQLMQQSRPERLTTFSSHSMPLKALVEIDFWKTNVVSEDSHIFWQCLLHYNSNWKVIPLFYPVYMDANVDRTFWKTMLNQYKQQRRWAYGAENFAFFSFIFLKDSFLFKGKQQFPFWKKVYWFLTILEGSHSWATNSLLIFLLGWLPLILGGSQFNLMLLSFSLPRITRYIMTLASIGIVTSAIMSLNFLPPKPPQYGRWRYLLFLIQWVLMPLNLIIFGSFPALDAQTRLMFGKYMGFWVTPKHRK